MLSIDGNDKNNKNSNTEDENNSFFELFLSIIYFKYRTGNVTSM